MSLTLTVSPTLIESPLMVPELTNARLSTVCAVTLPCADTVAVTEPRSTLAVRCVPIDDFEREFTAGITTSHASRPITITAITAIRMILSQLCFFVAI